MVVTDDHAAGTAFLVDFLRASNVLFMSEMISSFRCRRLLCGSSWLPSPSTKSTASRRPVTSQSTAEKLGVLRLLREVAVERRGRGNSTTRRSPLRAPARSLLRENRRRGNGAWPATAGTTACCHALCCSRSRSQEREAASARAARRRAPLLGSLAPRARDSSCSTVGERLPRERSAPGRVTLTSASSSGRRGSPPWRTSSTATASRSMRRRTSASRAGWPASAAAHVSRASRGRGVGHFARVLDEQEVAKMLEQVVDEPREILSSVREPPRRRRAGRRCRDRRRDGRRCGRVASSSTAPRSCSTDCTVIFLLAAAASWSSRETAAAARALRAMSRATRQALRASRRRQHGARAGEPRRSAAA